MDMRDRVAAVLTVAAIGLLSGGAFVAWGSGAALLMGGALFGVVAVALGSDVREPESWAPDIPEHERQVIEFNREKPTP